MEGRKGGEGMREEKEDHNGNVGWDNVQNVSS